MSRRGASRAVAGCVTAITALLLSATVAHAEFRIESFDTALTSPGTASAPSSSNLLGAGAHPDLTVAIRTPTVPEGQGYADGDLRGISTELPRGLSVNPSATTKCAQQEFNANDGGLPGCPVNSQVGTVEVGLANGAPGSFDEPAPLYNLAQPEGAPAQFGFYVAGVYLKLNGRVRADGGYGLGADIDDLPQVIGLSGARVRLWGVPADPVHDPARFDPVTYSRGAQSTQTPQALISNPTSCGAAQRFAVTATSWRPSDPIDSATDTDEPDGTPFEFSGCESLPFAPTASVRPTTTAPDSPTGLDLSVGIPQDSSPDRPATSHLRDLKITLPSGMAINPSAASGLQSCSSAQIGLGSAGNPTCPDASTLGTASITTPLLEQPLDGRVYLARQGDNPFGTLLGLYLVARGQHVQLKLAGRIDLDPATGQLVATFRDNPQLPFSRLEVHLDGGTRAPLTTPPVCGPQAATVDLSPWSGTATQTRTTGFSIDCGAGLGAFRPAFDAGTRETFAGTASPLLVNVDRPDGQPVLNRLSLRLPAGLLAKLRGVRRCASAQADAGACDALSRVGSVRATVGAGSDPFVLPGDVFLTGPHKGAPFGLSVKIRAVAGPLDLGTVVVRQALFIDPDDTHVDVVSDPLPTILSGIPIRLRALDVNVDRRDFTVNPSSCAAKRVVGDLGAVDGQNASVPVAFRVGGCDALELSPKLALRLGGGGRSLRDGGHPSLKAILTQPSGQSNLKRAEVKLPLSLALDPDNAQTLCEYAEGRKAIPRCPKGSIVGSAKARTPLLDRTLRGPVYFVKGQRIDAKTKRVIKTLPTLVVPLAGDGVRINLRTKTAVSGGRLVATFDPIPDAPVSRFDLSLNGGGQGILVANASVCSKPRELGIGIRGQNGALSRTTRTLAASCR